MKNNEHINQLVHVFKYQVFTKSDFAYYLFNYTDITLETAKKIANRVINNLIKFKMIKSISHGKFEFCGKIRNFDLNLIFEKEYKKYGSKALCVHRLKKEYCFVDFEAVIRKYHNQKLVIRQIASEFDNLCQNTL
jgi:hypothetical protein